MALENEFGEQTKHFTEKRTGDIGLKKIGFEKKDQSGKQTDELRKKSKD